jgi:hypothetical protein
MRSGKGVNTWADGSKYEVRSPPSCADGAASQGTSANSQ